MFNSMIDGNGDIHPLNEICDGDMDIDTDMRLEHVSNAMLDLMSDILIDTLKSKDDLSIHDAVVLLVNGYPITNVNMLEKEYLYAGGKTHVWGEIGVEDECHEPMEEWFREKQQQPDSVFQHGWRVSEYISARHLKDQEERYPKAVMRK